MSRMTSMRKQTRKSARRDNKALAASDARESALRYAETTRDWAAPKVEAARDWAAPKVEPVTTRVREDVLPKVAGAVTAGLVASEPAREVVKTRGTAAIAALRGEIEAPKPKKHRLRKFFLFSAVVGAAVAGWKAWTGQQNRRPDPWATPTPVTSGSAGTSGTGGSAGSAGSAGPGGPVLAAAPVTDDVGGASPDEALADAADEAAVGEERMNPGSPAGDTASMSTTEKVPPKAAKKVKAVGDTSRTQPRKST